MVTGVRQAAAALALLVVSALLEVGGDAAMRFGLRGKPLGLLIGVITLSAYGLAVNVPRWDFGRLLGVYIAIFFVVSQAVATLVFREKLTVPSVVGGALIVAGGAVVAIWQKR